MIEAAHARAAAWWPQRAAGRGGHPPRARDGRHGSARSWRSTWEDLDGTGVLRIRTEKHGPDRSLQLSESTVRLLQQLPERRRSRGLIFPSCRTGYERGDIRRFWNAVRKKAKVEHIRFHDLRHTAASEMLRRGAAAARSPVRPGPLLGPDDGALRPLRCRPSSLRRQSHGPYTDSERRFDPVAVPLRSANPL